MTAGMGADMGWAPAKAGADGGEMGVVKRPSVSVVLPALNEEATVAAVIESVRPSLAAGIVDEIIVVDSDSTDATAEVAAAAGAPDSPELAPARLGDVPRSALAFGRAREVLGWEPLTPIEEGVAQTVEYFRSRA